MNKSNVIKILLIVLFTLPVACIEKVDTTRKVDSEKLATEDMPLERTIYYIAFLRRGPKWTADITPEIEEVLKGHFANIEKLKSEGKLALVGPFLEQSGDSALAGLFLFRVDSIEQAISLVEQDPGIKAGRYTYEVVPWYGPKNLTY